MRNQAQGNFEMKLKCMISLVVALAAWNLGAAQDLFIANARIIDGTGESIRQGSVSIVDGRIVSAGPDAAIYLRAQS